MAIIKTAILQTHVYTDKFRNITQAAELLASPELTKINTFRNMPKLRAEIPGKNVPDWRQNTEFIS